MPAVYGSGVQLDVRHQAAVAAAGQQLNAVMPFHSAHPGVGL